MADNIPRVTSEKDYKAFFNAVKSVLDKMTGKKPNTEIDRALTVRDLEKFGVDPVKFLNCSKKNPYPL